LAKVVQPGGVERAQRGRALQRHDEELLCYGMARVRYLGLARNNCHLQFVACAMNMKRALVLLGAA
jgi:IS5 family transposase